MSYVQLPDPDIELRDGRSNFRLVLNRSMRRPNVHVPGAPHHLTGFPLHDHERKLVTFGLILQCSTQPAP